MDFIQRTKDGRESVIESFSRENEGATLYVVGYNLVMDLGGVDCFVNEDSLLKKVAEERGLLRTKSDRTENNSSSTRTKFVKAVKTDIRAELLEVLGGDYQEVNDADA